jgi:hypothetical protein
MFIKQIFFNFFYWSSSSDFGLNEFRTGIGGGDNNTVSEINRPPLPSVKRPSSITCRNKLKFSGGPFQIRLRVSKRKVYGVRHVK